MKTPLLLLGASLMLSGVTLAQGSDDGCNPQNIASKLNNIAFNNTAATFDGGADCDGKPARKDVWYRWQAPATGGYVIFTCGQTSLATRIVIYDDQACPVANPIACGSIGCSNGETSFSFPTVVNNWYIIRIGSKFPNQTGSGTFSLHFDPCWGIPDDAFEDNDACDAAWPLADGLYQGLKTSKTDTDYFAFDVADGATLDVTAFFTHASGNIETFLFDACGGIMLDNGGSITDDEVVTWTNTTGACVRTVFEVQLWISDPNNECNLYDLDVAGASPPGTCGPTNIGNNYCGPANNNSTGQPGVISAIGSAVAADNDVTLFANQLPVDVFGYYLASETQGFIQNPPGSDGNLCLGGKIGRFVKQVKKSDSTGEISIVVDLLNIPVTPPVAVMAGETWNFQAWYRDKKGGQATSNFTDGLAILFQ